MLICTHNNLDLHIELKSPQSRHILSFLVTSVKAQGMTSLSMVPFEGLDLNLISQLKELYDLPCDLQFLCDKICLGLV